MKYKSFTLIFALSFSVSVFPQEFDEAFLKSLPDEISADLVKRSMDRDALEETQYRRPSTFIEKPEPTSNRYGAKIFSMMQSTLMPLNEPNFDSSYILDFGDELELQLIGQQSSTAKMMVKRDGSINIKDIGKLFIAGMTLDKAVNIIQKRVSQSFIGVEAYVSLTNVRDIQIVTAGNVYNPGSYTLNGNSNIFHALSVSGGPSIQGSFRSIDLIRNNKIIENIDLYDTFIYGKPSFDKRLRSGDIIFVNAVQVIVSANGAFKRPGVYELTKDEKLSKLVFFANGSTPFADKNNIKLERPIDGRVKQIPLTSFLQLDNMEPKDGDSVFIRKFSFRKVNISGAVLNPGDYLMNEGDKVTDIIEKAGGLTSMAYPFGAIYETNKARKNNQYALDMAYRDSLDQIIENVQKTGSDIDLTPFIAISQQIREAEVSGRVIIDILESNNEQLLIQDGDTLIIPEKGSQVYVYGAVTSAGSVKYKANEPIDYYLKRKGGLNSNADKKNIYIIQPNGESVSLDYRKNIFKGRMQEDLIIHPGSIIYVEKLNNNSLTQRLTAQAYASIFGNIGVTLASLSVLKD